MPAYGGCPVGYLENIDEAMGCGSGLGRLMNSTFPGMALLTMKLPLASASPVLMDW